MEQAARDESGRLPLARGQAGAYAAALGAFLLGMTALWVLGIESVYEHPAPFYALVSPAADWGAAALALLLWGATLTAAGYAAQPGRPFQGGGARLAGAAFAAAAVCLGMAARQNFSLDPAQAAAHVLAVGVGGGGLLAALYALRRARFFTGGPPTWRTGYFLLALFAFSIAFACALAMLRGGLSGIAAPYTRVQYEYAGDIGVTSGIRDLFRRYNEISPYLTLHARAAPPGPIAILWSFTYILGNDPLALALCTVVWGSIAVVPFFFWVREMSTPRVAVIAGLLYVFCPGIVLFTATSAEILFMPFTLTTLFLFERAIRRGSPWAAAGAGIGYGMMAHLKFTLIGIGVYFALAGLRFIAQPGRRIAVIQTAAIMLACALGVIGAVWLWSGFDIITCFQQAKHHFDLDQIKLDEITPRYPHWAYFLLNPWAWFFFAGIPASVLSCAALTAKHPRAPECVTILLALSALNLLFWSRGEAERSALYMYPLIIAPAALMLEQLTARAQDPKPLLAALGFMALQCWAVETILYTYW